jgi:hypothetical protein
MKHCRASCAGVVQTSAPAAAAALCAAGRMSRERTHKPARTRLGTTPSPIAPVPITPTGARVGGGRVRTSAPNTVGNPEA